MARVRRPQFDWNASMNKMLGYSGESDNSGWRTSLIVNYEAAMALPVSQLDEMQLGRFWGQNPSDEMLDVLIPTTIEHLRHDPFSSYGTPTFLYLARAENYTTRPELEAAFCALLETSAPRLVTVLREDHVPPVTNARYLPPQLEVARCALEAAERYPSALFAFENAYRAIGDHAGVADILARRARRTTGVVERIALLVERARLHETNLDLESAQRAWLDVLRVDPTTQHYDELVRLVALDPDPWWWWLITELRGVARDVEPAAAAVELLRHAADLAATKLDDPDFVADILHQLAAREGSR